MLLLLTLPVVFIVAHVYGYLQLYAPSNLLIAHVRTSPPRWRTATFLLTLAYALIWATHYLSMAIQNGAPGWLNLVVMVLAWDAIKTALLGVHTMLRAVGRVAMRVSKRTTGPHLNPRACKPAARFRG